MGRLQLSITMQGFVNFKTSKESIIYLNIGNITLNLWFYVLTDQNYKFKTTISINLRTIISGFNFVQIKIIMEMKQLKIM